MNHKNNYLDIDLNKQPSTRYQGSKRKLIPWIYNNIKDLEFNTCLDAFGGTASVSYLFKKMGKQVTYNDILKFNFIIGKAIIENNNTTLVNGDLSRITNVAEVNFVKETFKDIYYLDHENSWIDKILGNIINMNHYPDNILEYKKSLAYYALFQSCLIKRPFNLFHRKNLSLRTKKVERNFGNKFSWDKPFYKHFDHFIKEANNLIFDSGQKCVSINKSALEVEGDYDLVYLDPPYYSKNHGNETADYIHSYHFLEGLSRYREWANLIDYHSLNYRFKDSFCTDYFTEANIIEKVEELICRFNKSIIVFSYKKGGKPSIETLIKLIKKFKKNVYSRSIQYSYALNRQNGNKSRNREVLIIGL